MEHFGFHRTKDNKKASIFAGFIVFTGLSWMVPDDEMVGRRQPNSSLILFRNNDKTIILFLRYPQIYPLFFLVLLPLLARYRNRGAFPGPVFGPSVPLLPSPPLRSVSQTPPDPFVSHRGECPPAETHVIRLQWYTLGYPVNINHGEESWNSATGK